MISYPDFVCLKPGQLNRFRSSEIQAPAVSACLVTQLKFMPGHARGQGTLGVKTGLASYLPELHASIAELDCFPGTIAPDGAHWRRRRCSGSCPARRRSRDRSFERIDGRNGWPSCARESAGRARFAALHQNRLVAAPEQRAVAALVAVEELRVHAIQVPRATTAVAKRRVQQQMVMIAHQEIGMRFDAETDEQVTQ